MRTFTASLLKSQIILSVLVGCGSITNENNNSLFFGTWEVNYYELSNSPERVTQPVNSLVGVVSSITFTEQDFTMVANCRNRAHGVFTSGNKSVNVNFTSGFTEIGGCNFTGEKSDVNHVGNITMIFEGKSDFEIRNNAMILSSERGTLDLKMSDQKMD